MATNRNPRVVVVTRPTPFELLVARHATVAQAAFFLETRDQSIAPLRESHERQQDALQRVTSAIPVSWRRTRVDRDDLDRFLFEEDDIVVAVGQDGLVANTAKYLRGQSVIGINPEPDTNAGILVPHPPAAIGDLLADVADDRADHQERTMVEAEVDGGFKLRALNEIFVGHRTHQSARYRLRWRGSNVRHSSSGVIVASGTGSTGWARSICQGRPQGPAMPRPEDPDLVFFVREAWPSPGTDCTVTAGVVDDGIAITSEMNDGGVVFGDGIEEDRIEFGWGRTCRIRRATDALRLVC